MTRAMLLSMCAAGLVAGCAVPSPSGGESAREAETPVSTPTSAGTSSGSAAPQPPAATGQSPSAPSAPSAAATNNAPETASSSGWTQGAPAAAAHTPPSYGGIPPTAQRVADGTGHLSYRAPSDGRVWIGNESRQYQIMARNIRRNDRVDVYPDRDRIEVNGKTVYDKNLEKRDRHEVFFAPSAYGEWGPPPYDGIPGDAETVASDSGRFEWRADATGMVFIGDDRDKKFIVRHNVKPGDVVEVNPGKDQVKVNGTVIYSKNLESKHRHSIFFK